MPHRAVIKEDRTTTKIRIVFDASSHERGAKSLIVNSESGTSSNPDVAAFLLRFRRYKVAMTADVEKAFLQIACMRRTEIQCDSSGLQRLLG
ncbi:hypothetical protein HPB49_005295 [Dermacentor silvarum]|uniref:Uncharacterized protein n=1 Tax=Dermacentor silvarum TaxID=543639 RepID=A0ACB8DML2_DERSI|nr:hypothetical protein HPB49_005295 [Dermacentor silvarum]